MTDHVWLNTGQIVSVLMNQLLAMWVVEFPSYYGVGWVECEIFISRPQELVWSGALGHQIGQLQPQIYAAHSNRSQNQHRCKYANDNDLQNRADKAVCRYFMSNEFCELRVSTEQDSSVKYSTITIYGTVFDVYR